jgi:glycosyltransferase involved in cell wall biosynthesis
VTRILVATDAWRPQVNGVVRSLENLAEAALGFGAKIEFLTPRDFYHVPMPTYPEIDLAVATPRAVARRVGEDCDHVHIATEGPVGLAARRACLRLGRCFTTSYHTRFPEYIQVRTGLPTSLAYCYLRWFHNAGDGVMVAAASVARELSERGFQRILRWSRGVDHEVFRPAASPLFEFPRPIFLYAGRLAVEKNVEAFLSLDLPGSKLVAGDGPARPWLQQQFPNAHFLGMKTSAELAALYSGADVLVFPSRTDTFGLVLVEAMACGLPVAALPVAGPLDVVGSSGAGVLSEDLRAAALAALAIDRRIPRAHAANFTWRACARQFLDNIAIARSVKVLGEAGRRRLAPRETDANFWMGRRSSREKAAGR